tara:strand:- start:452 stop:655 length:204 start_codon:yes stop_codon:yes gene_type:complete
MKNKIINKIVSETTDTIIDNINEVLVDYVYEYELIQDYDNQDKFPRLKRKIFIKVVEELHNRINKIK